MKQVSFFSLLFCIIFYTIIVDAYAQNNHEILAIGKADDTPSGMALAPDSYKDFLKKDFGWEDGYFLIGKSEVSNDWPYVLPGPADHWGGSGSLSGIRTRVLNVLFGLKKKPNHGTAKLIVDLVGYNRKVPPLLKITVNGKSWKYSLPKGKVDSTIYGKLENAREYKIEVPVDYDLLKVGGNEINLTILRGSWVVFDQIRLEGSEEVKVEKPHYAFIRDIKIAEYELTNHGKRYQPLIIDVQHLESSPELKVKLDEEVIFTQTLESGRYKFEALMPSVESETTSNYKIIINNNLVRTGTVLRKPQPIQTFADYVNTMMGTAHSRWMIAPGPWMPFGMIKLSPDNENKGWQGGYDPSIENVGTFSHIHAWTMAGLGTMPTNGPLQIKMGDQYHPDEGYRSRIDKSSEKAPLGYYRVHLTDYNITVELTATTRAGFQRYTYPSDTTSRVLIDLKIPAEYDYQLKEVQIKKVNDHRIIGFSKQHSSNVWSDTDQDYTVHFVLEFDHKIEDIGFWVNDELVNKNKLVLHARNLNDAGAYVEFETRKDSTVQMRSGISLVSIENASLNLKKEITIPFGWNFEAVQAHQEQVWNKLLSRIKIKTNDKREKKRFYTNMYRALSGRTIWSDVNGEWIDATEQVQQLKDSTAVVLGGDAFWNTFWNLNQFWNLVTPEWSSKWIKSQLAMYKANGWLAKGPAGMEYIPVMVAEHEIQLIVSAYQMGIRDYNAKKAFEAVYQTLNRPPEKIGGGLAGNLDFKAFLKYHYVPYDKGRFSNTLEYAFDAWALSQFAKVLNKPKIYKEFRKRGRWWRNVIDEETGYARLKDSDGNWMIPFDPLSGANAEYVEGNAWQLTFFVPQNVLALADEIGQKRFINRLKWGFKQSYKWRFNAPNEQYWAYPVVQGNQQSMHFAWLFNWVGKPWLTQKWSRAIMDRYYGYGTSNAYLGDEDQGQMSAWFVMNAIGLFQTAGGARAKPVYEIASPLYKKVVIDLGGRYGRGEKFVILAKNTSRKNKYVQKAYLNGEELNSFKFPAKKLLEGGKLVLIMGDEPNKNWGVINSDSKND